MFDFIRVSKFLNGRTTGFEPANKGVTIQCLTTWPRPPFSLFLIMFSFTKLYQYILLQTNCYFKVFEKRVKKRKYLLQHHAFKSSTLRCPHRYVLHLIHPLTTCIFFCTFTQFHCRLTQLTSTCIEDAQRGEPRVERKSCILVKRYQYLYISLPQVCASHQPLSAMECKVKNELPIRAPAVQRRCKKVGQGCTCSVAAKKM